MKKAFLILLLAFLSSCQTLKIADEKPSCLELDWFELGRSDGAQGLESLTWQKREVACKEFSESHHQSYVNGWYAGVDEFCSSSHGFAFGKTGSEYYNVCPTSKEETFIRAYQKGLKVFNFEEENKRISTEIDSLSTQTDKLQQNDKKILEEKISQLQDKKEAIRLQISEIETEMETVFTETTSVL